MKKVLTFALCFAVVGSIAPRAPAQPGPSSQPRFPSPGIPGPGQPGGDPVGGPFQPRTDFGRLAPPFGPAQAEKDRKEQSDLDMIAHLPHVHVPEVRPAPEVYHPEFRAAPEAFEAFRPSGLRPVSVGWGGGVLAGIGGAIASAFGALFGRRKDKTSA